MAKANIWSTSPVARDVDIGRPEDGLLLEKIAMLLQMLADVTVDAEELGAPE